MNTFISSLIQSTLNTQWLKRFTAKQVGIPAVMVGCLLSGASTGSAWSQPLDRQASPCQPSVVAPLKAALLKQAEAFKGQGDPDRSKQATLDVLVQDLLAACPQPEVKTRLPLLAGPWQQVWGPYTYSNKNRGVDAEVDPNNIYQVVFPGGYYYNVAPRLDKKGKPKGQSILLRGEYVVDAYQHNVLNIHFTSLRGVHGKGFNAKNLKAVEANRTVSQADTDPSTPANLTYIALPKLAEQGRLSGTFTSLPSLFVKWFFGGGQLREVYTDEDLRITYGSSNRSNLADNYLYILKRVNP
jgi:hypothetical protein